MIVRWENFNLYLRRERSGRQSREALNLIIIKMEEYEETHDEEGRHFKVKVGNVEVGILDFDRLFYFEFTNYGSTQERWNALNKCSDVYNFEN